MEGADLAKLERLLRNLSRVLEVEGLTVHDATDVALFNEEFSYEMLSKWVCLES